MTDILKRTDTFVSRLKNYGSIIFSVLVFVIGGSTAYFQISANTRNQELLKISVYKALQQQRIDQEVHLKQLEDRSNNRYSRGMDQAKQIWKYGESATQRIRDLEIEQARHDERIKNLIK